MIHTVSVATGDTPCADAAELHALELAGMFQARLRAVVVREREELEEALESGVAENFADLAEEELKDFFSQAGDAGVFAEGAYRTEGMPRSLLAEARETDLLVVGMPTEGLATDDPLARSLLHDELPLLRKAESSVLVICKDPEPLRDILVVYQYGMEGKDALRLAGAIAEKTGAGLHVLSHGGDATEAELITSTAAEYLRGFDIDSVNTLDRHATPSSQTEVIEAAGEINAGLIVIGDEPYGLLERFFGGATAESLALQTEIPVLIAR